ncbi:small G protein signaling modulator 2-like isoform X2 [Asparagus officinalis]|uniref:small G protein signaling modulator 2-like isoform X2 n=1 Tax=Asparagus officinalis TaxID=4686 RepID=UPI00098E3307|nr:small G protein signaling modulator 2-like isoform X2 [Asparagus officinalis]
MLVWGWAERGGGGGLNVGVAVGLTAMAGLALAATFVISSSYRRSISSPWTARKRRNALSSRRWESLFSAEGKLRDGGVKLLKKARSGGIDPSIRAEVWPFLLGVYDLNSTEAERNTVKVQKRKEYEALRRRCRRILSHNRRGIYLLELCEFGKGDSCCLDEIPESSSTEVRNLTEGESDHFDQPLYDTSPESKSCNLDEEEEDRSGITNIEVSLVETESSDSDSSFEEESESTAASCILEQILDPESKYSCASHKRDPSIRTTEDFETWQRIIRLDAVRANAEWVIYSPSQALVSEEQALQSAASVGLKDFDHLEPCMIYHAARLVAVLEAYAIYDPETGYCQGMSDLLSPILAVMEEDHDAFWCFVGFMKKARHNFRLDEVGIRRQLKLVAKIIQTKDLHLYRHLEKLQAEDCFFVYRMVVVLFRRELTFEQTVSLWEVMWADQAAVRAGIRKSAWGRIRAKAPPTDDLLLYAIAACVLQKRKLLIERSSSMDEIMRECNSLSGQLDVWRLLDDAHDLVATVHDKIE